VNEKRETGGFQRRAERVGEAVAQKPVHLRDTDRDDACDDSYRVVAAIDTVWLLLVAICFANRRSPAANLYRLP
jgi:hypothetical protein